MALLNPVSTARPVPATPPQRPAPDRAPDALPGAALAVLLLGFSLSVTDFFIVNVALPAIGRDFRTSDTMLELVVAAYGISYAVLLVLGGRLGDAVGRRRLFTGGMAAFTITSLACALAPGMGVLLAARACQGASAALMVPQVLATIQARTDGAARARAVGLYGATAGLSMVAGQLLGGTITWADAFGTGWRGIFLVNVPLGIIGLVVAHRAMPDSRSGLPARIDVRGTVVLAATLLALLIPLTEGKALGWPAWSWILLGCVPAGAALFAWIERAHERRGEQPLVPPSLLAHPSMRTGLALAAPFFASFGGFMFLYAVVTQGFLGLGALAAGATLAPLAGAFCLASLVTPRAVARWGRDVISVGAAAQAAGYAGLLAAVAADWPHLPLLAVTPALVVAGFGQGLVVSPLLRTILSDVPAERAGAGAGVLATTQQTSLALGVAVVGSLFSALVPQTGVKVAAMAVIALVITTASFVAAGSRRLPSPRTAAGRVEAGETVPSLTRTYASRPAADI